MAELDLTAIAAASIATPAAGVEAVYIETTTKRLASKNDAGTVSDYVDLTSTQTLAGKTLTTPVIGAATGTSVVLTGAITTSNAAGAGIGYATGSGGAVTQLTSKATAFTLSKLNGTIQFAADALAAGTNASSVWTNTAIAATDNCIITHASGGTIGAYNFGFTPAAGSATLTIRNITAGSLTEAPVIRFSIIKGVVA